MGSSRLCDLLSRDEITMQAVHYTKLVSGIHMLVCIRLYYTRYGKKRFRCVSCVMAYSLPVNAVHNIVLYRLDRLLYNFIGIYREYSGEALFFNEPISLRLTHY